MPQLIEGNLYQSISLVGKLNDTSEVAILTFDVTNDS